MTDHVAGPNTPASSRLAELHQLCDRDFAKGRAEQASAQPFPPYTPFATAFAAPEPSDLAVAIRVAQQLLDCDQVLSLREALRLLLRALDAEPDDEKGVELVPTPGGDQARAETHTPVGLGCGAPATARIEGYSPRGGIAQGSLDLAVYACTEHTPRARTEWLGGLNPHTMPVVVDARCGHSFDYTTLGGGQ